MNYLLTDEQKMIKDLAHKIAEEKIRPVAAQYDKSEEFPWEVMKEFSKADLCGLYIPTEYGGFGGGAFEFCLAVEEISRVCGGIGVTFAASALGTVPGTSLHCVISLAPSSLDTMTTPMARSP